ncbi:MAG: GNAT family N-acetyltransferase [Actinomycetota bacterium]
MRGSPCARVEGVVAVRWLEPGVAEDLELALAATDVVNRAYAHAENGLFATKIDRTDVKAVIASISRRETAVALLDGAVVGSVRARALNDRTGWFGGLGVEPAVQGQGFGAALVGFVEDDAAAAGRAEMQLEVFESEPVHPHLSRIRAWYERRGYHETSRLPLDALYPEDAARLIVAALDVVTLRKSL